MNVHTPSEHILAKSSFNLTITAAAVNGTTVDTKGWTRAFILFYSTPSGAGTTSDCKVQMDSDSGMGSPTDISGAAFAQATTAGGASMQVMNLDVENGNVERYIRLVHTGAGASAAGVATGVIFLLRGRRIAPTQEETVISV